VVVNDGGQDVAHAIQSLPQGATAKISMLELQSSQGAAAARNMALRAARGSIIAFLDDDDLYLPGHLDTLVAAMLASGAPFAYTQSIAVEERIVDGRRVAGRTGTLREYKYSRAILQVRNVIPTACWAIRRECFDLYGGFDASLPCAEDWDLLLRYSERIPFHRVPEVTAEIRVRAEVADSVTQRTPLRPMCELFYRRHPSRGHALIELAREIYLASVS
jgi:glycosyltransferase involved in cell wall biosynthesis